MGLVYYRARYYDPSVGRFTARDPVGYLDGLNRYAYVGNNPVNFTDPLGLTAQGPLAIQFASQRASYYSGDQGVLDSAGSAYGYGYGPVPFADRSVASGPPVTSGRIQLADAGTTASDADREGLLIGCGQGTRTLGAGQAMPSCGVSMNGPGSPLGVAETVLNLAPELKGPLVLGTVGKVANTARVVNPNKLEHIFGNTSHNLDALVTASGGSQANAFNAVQDAANAALREGRLTVGPNGVLPGGQAGAILNVNGVNVQLVGGRVINGEAQIGSFSRRFLNE